MPYKLSLYRMTGQFLPRVPTRLDQRWPIFAVRGASPPALNAGITCLIVPSMSKNIEEKRNDIPEIRQFNLTNALGKSGVSESMLRDCIKRVGGATIVDKGVNHGLINMSTTKQNVVI